MNRKEVFQIIDRFEESSLTSLSIKDGDFSIAMDRPSVDTAGKAKASLEKTEHSAEKAENFSEKTDSPSDEEKNKDLTAVKAPLVGTYYAAPNPDEEPFVKEGDTIAEGQTLCIIESMKMLNEVKSTETGKIVKIYGIDGEMVEFDQVLFEVEKC